ncbi:rhodanese domain-containing protein CG4456 isoform X2 [Cherax quadricarinatus]|uniref:rhodanese domain-containing protein CG4456 isoform X2 n=1 Tax=Cherax quadricarinatus TaxID=27406 RepID=UPI0023793F8D|nr:rhodanese domain-containing protein CG4456-like isoform X2 [Cherax quadricarinatus]
MSRSRLSIVSLFRTASEMNWLVQVPRAILKPGCHFYAPSLIQASRYFTTNVTLPPDIDFQELKQKVEDNKLLLIDVRTPDELILNGRIPKSKNLVLQMLGVKLLLPEEEFASQLGFDKPKLAEPIVVSCLGGIRARTAQLAMMGVGYKNVRVYVGSYEDWLEKGGPVEYPQSETQEE